MTQGGWGSNPFDPHPAGQNPFTGPHPGGPGAPGFPGPPPPPPPENNVLATLSVVFAFVFAPVGAILGHLALSQPQQHHRDRALVGLTLSYTFIVVAVVATVVWATQGRPTDPTPATAAPTTPAAAAPLAPPPATTTPPPPPPPTVAPADLAGLLPSIDDVRTITGTPDLTTQKTTTEPVPDAELGATFDPAECQTAAGVSPEHIYAENHYQGYYGRSDRDSSLSTQFSAGAISFPDAASAQRFVTAVTDQWRQCAGRQVTQVSTKGTGRAYFSVGDPIQDNGITTLRNTVTSNGSMHGVQSQTIAAKSNVAVGVYVFAADPGDQATTITRRALDRIPS